MLVAMMGAAPAHGLTDEGRLRLLQRETLRVETVFLRLARAGSALCPRQASQLGIVLHQRAQYRPEVRAAAARAFGLGEGPAVLAVVPGSAAQQAGLVAGDAIVAVNGAALPAFATGSTQGNAGRLAREALDRAVIAGPATLTVLRDKHPISLRLVDEQACAGMLTVEPSQALVTQAGEGRIVITTQLVEFVREDDELAFLIGHELAHVAADERRGRESEAQADLAGLRFLRAAGYDVCAAPAVLDRLAAARHQGRRIDLDHPSPQRRVAALRAAIGGTCPPERG